MNKEASQAVESLFETQSITDIKEVRYREVKRDVNFACLGCSHEYAHMHWPAFW